MKIIGVGTDLTSIKRIKACLQKHPKRLLEKIFTDKEQNLISKHKNPITHIAKRWAGKEACIKAMNKTCSWREIEITNTASGQPEAKIINQPQMQIHLSLCDEGPYASACAIAIQLD